MAEQLLPRRLPRRHQRELRALHLEQCLWAKTTWSTAPLLPSASTKSLIIRIHTNLDLFIGNKSRNRSSLFSFFSSPRIVVLKIADRQNGVLTSLLGHCLMFCKVD